MFCLRSTLAAAEIAARRLFVPQLYSLELAGVPGIQSNLLEEALWFAVPKKKVTRSKKRMKTTKQKRMKLRQDIIADPRTGEATLRHKLPFNWRETYIPKFD